jgi:starch phosphorylase
VRTRTGVSLDPGLPVLGFARRMTGYKRPMLLFHDIDRLAALAARHPFQLVMAGKAHPRDMEGKEAIRRVHEAMRRLDGKVTCAFLADYDMRLAKTLVSGADVWLNTPLPPMEASGTSGMKAALNGVLNLSVPDGWWIEGCVEGVTGWSIGTGDDGSADVADAASLYDKLEHVVLPLYATDAAGWRSMMKQAIANIGYYFNSQRMMRRYATEAYLR